MSKYLYSIDDPDSFKILTIESENPYHIGEVIILHNNPMIKFRIIDIHHIVLGDLKIPSTKRTVFENHSTDLILSKI